MAAIQKRDWNVKTTNKFSSLKAGVAPVVIGLAMLSSPAFAQAAAEEEAGEIVVTGTRIARPNVEAASPVTVVTSEAIKEFGATKIEDLTNSLPQVFAGQSSGVSNGADGTATIDLRGLGASRTVVLIDGRRLMPGNIGGGAGADLNFIPAALVSGVELLTGGASATYGADAVAGVVNFKMNRGFRGVRIDSQYGFYQHNNSNDDIQSIVNGSGRVTAPEGSVVTGQSYDATLALGAGFDDDRGNIVAYAGYRRESAITQDKYDYSICTLNAAGASFACGGSGTPARARFGGLLSPTAGRTQATDPDTGALLFNDDGTPTLTSPTTVTRTLLDNNSLRAYSAATDAYNFGPANYYRRPSDRYTAGAFAEYEISDSFKPYMDVMFMDYSTDAQIAPSGAFYGPRTVNCDNPLLLANAALAALVCQTPGTTLGATPTSTVGQAVDSTILIGKRNVEGGNRYNDIGFNQFRIVTGMKGDISESWSYDVFAQMGQIKVANTYRNDVSSARIDRALQVVNVNGVATCKSVVDGTDPSCVPYNVFNAGGITPEAAAYLGIPLVLTGTTKEKVFSGQITGDLGAMGFQSPLAEEAVKVAFGVENRTESLETQPDLSYINGDGAGQGGPTLPISGRYSVTDIFAETALPLVSDKAFFHELSLELGFRRSTYDVRGKNSKNSENTWKIAGTWSPVEDITFRASRNRAVRSPNIGELFSNASIGLFSGSDPCVNDPDSGVPSATSAQCALTGLPTSLYGTLEANTAEQYNQFGGGNLNLRPEKADSWTAGVVLTPKGFLNGFTASVDYYNIKVKDAIGTIGAQVIIDQCIATGNPFLCGKINRATSGPSAGSLWLDESGFVNNQTTNTGSFSSAGVDINADYRTTIGNNKLKWEFVGTYLDKYTAQPITNGFSYDCAGFYGITCGNPNPKYRFNTNLKLTTANDFGFTVRWRYLGGVKVDTSSTDPDLAGSSPAIDQKIPSQSYFDLLFALPIKDSMTLRIGVNNIFDRDPPLISQSSLGGFGNGNTFPGTYDYLGRNVFVNLSADF